MSVIMRVDIMEIASFHMMKVFILLPIFRRVVFAIAKIPIVIIVPSLVPIVVDKVVPSEGGPIVVIGNTSLQTEIPCKRHLCSSWLAGWEI